MCDNHTYTPRVPIGWVSVSRLTLSWCDWHMMKEEAGGEELKRKHGAWKHTKSKHALQVLKRETRVRRSVENNSQFNKLSATGWRKTPACVFSFNLLEDLCQQWKMNQTGFQAERSLLISLVSIRGAVVVGKGLLICTGTAVHKPKNNPQSAVHCEQSTLIAAEQPSGGNLPKLLNIFTRKSPGRRRTNE